MGSNNGTHFDGQVLAECPTCAQTLRLLPSNLDTMDVPEPTLSCGSCGTTFRAERATGEVQEVLS